MKVDVRRDVFLFLFNTGFKFCETYSDVFFAMQKTGGSRAVSFMILARPLRGRKAPVEMVTFNYVQRQVKSQLDQVELVKFGCSK